MHMSSFDIQAVRARFPALAQDQIYFDNAGGSQTLDSVIDSIRDYLTCTNVQLGATYKTGLQSISRYNAGYEAAAKYINCAPSEIVFGASTTQLLRNVSYSLDFESGDMIISEIDHEANIASWLDFAKRRGLAVKWWKASTGPSPKLQIEELRNILTENTRLVTCSHASNVLGTINDIKQIASEIHSKSTALFCVDAVAYAPHRPIDVQGLGVDFYVFSWYKVYGPHISMLFANERAQVRMKSLGHFFNPTRTLENKIGLAGASYELVQAIPAVTEYLGSPDSARWHGVVDQEHQLQKIVLEYLNKREDVTVFGETSADPAVRVPTISFVVKGWKSKELVEAVEKVSNIGFRWGSFYSNRLVATLLENATDGVVRVSMVHYNTVKEANHFVSMLDRVLSRR